MKGPCERLRFRLALHSVTEIKRCDPRNRHGGESIPGPVSTTRWGVIMFAWAGSQQARKQRGRIKRCDPRNRHGGESIPGPVLHHAVGRDPCVGGFCSRRGNSAEGAGRPVQNLLAPDLCLHLQTRLFRTNRRVSPKIFFFMVLEGDLLKRAEIALADDFARCSLKPYKTF